MHSLMHEEKLAILMRCWNVYIDVALLLLRFFWPSSPKDSTVLVFVPGAGGQNGVIYDRPMTKMARRISSEKMRKSWFEFFRPSYR